MTEKTCSACKSTLPLESFTARNRKCKPCVKAYDRARYVNGVPSAQTSRDRRFQYKYGITEGERDAMAELQNHNCAIVKAEMR